MQLCGAQKEDSALLRSLPSNQAGSLRDSSVGSSKHLLYGVAQVANKGADCVFKTITATAAGIPSATEILSFHESLKCKNRYSSPFSIIQK